MLGLIILTLLTFGLGFLIGYLVSIEEISNLTLYLKAVMRKAVGEKIQLLLSDIENSRDNKLTIKKWKSGSLSIPVIDITSSNKKEY